MSRPVRVPDLLVEQLAKGELSPARAADVRRRLEAEPGGMARLAAIAADDAALQARFEVDAGMRRVRAKAAEQAVAEALHRPARARWATLGGVLALAALVLVVWGRGPVDPGLGGVPELVDDGTRAKGIESRLEVFRKEGDVARPLAEGDVVAAGQVVQVAYRSAGRRHGAILSVDGRGVVTLHHPASVRGDTRLAPGGRVLLEHAYELDDAPEHETFLFLASDAPIDVAAVAALVRVDGAAADVGRVVPGAEIHRLRLSKAAP